MMTSRKIRISTPPDISQHFH